MVYSFTTTRLEACEHDEAPRDVAALTIPLDLECGNVNAEITTLLDLICREKAVARRI